MRFQRNGLSSTAGLTLIEIVASIAIFAVVVLAVGMTLLSGSEHYRESFESYRARNALRDMVAEIQENANLPQDLSTMVGIGSMYRRYNGQTFAVADVPGADITVTCFANEAAVPTILGGPQDLNYDGDAADDLGNISQGTDLKLVPMILTVTFGDPDRRQTFTIHRLISVTAD